MKVFACMLLCLSLTSCSNCSELPPNVILQPGIDHCGAMCEKFVGLNCTGYFEDIKIDCSIDPIYKKTMACNDKGQLILTCKQVCEYEQKNSVQLNPKCLAEQLKACEEIETICR